MLTPKERKRPIASPGIRKVIQDWKKREKRRKAAEKTADKDIKTGGKP